jgi:hypothetical protein
MIQYHGHPNPDSENRPTQTGTDRLRDVDIHLERHCH